MQVRIEAAAAHATKLGFPARVSREFSSPRRISIRQVKRRRCTRLYGFKEWWRDFVFKDLKVEFLVLPDDYHFPDEDEMDEVERLIADEEAFTEWKQKSDAIYELRQLRKLGRELGDEDWEDWLDEGWTKEGWTKEGWLGSETAAKNLDKMEQELQQQRDEIEARFIQEKLKDPQKRSTGLFSRLFQDPPEVEKEGPFEQGFAKYAAKSTVRFVTCLILIPWLADFVVHDYVLTPFLKRYVDLVPLAAKTFDVSDDQKLKRVIPALHDEQRWLEFEAEIGVTPPLSQEELYEDLHDKALELLEEVRAENRSNFANIWSDMFAGITLFLLLYFNPLQVELMSFSGNRLLSNLSNIGKAFFIILFSDIFLGYHSESGWEALVELFLEHYGFEASTGAVYTFVAIVPVTIDVGFKYWLFRYLPRISPSTAATFREMQRH